MRKELTLMALSALILAACGGKEDPVVVPDTPKAPSAPANVKLHKATETSLQFQWDAVEGAASYAWELQKDGAKVKEGTAGTRNTTISDLTKATNYRFGVKAVNDGGSSSMTWVDAKTEGTDDPEPPTPPSGQYYEQFSIPSAEEDGVARAFPGAEGGGMYATGGRGGKIYHVTSLEDNSTQGTLRYGIEKGDRPLTIVFDVAGTIALEKQLNITRGDLTIAGQSAPGDGICLKNYTFRISASNVIVRFIRCRMGDEKKTEDDAMQVMSHDDDKYEKIIIDHCSVSWCTDECASFYGMKDFTFQWNIVSESLRNSVHGKGSHGYGGIWGGTNATYHHNLLAHHDSRNPRIDHDYVSTQKGPVSIVNNVVYNWYGDTCYGGESFNNSGTSRKYNFFSNYYKPGPVTPSNHIRLLNPMTSCDNCSALSEYPDHSPVPSSSSVVPGKFFMAGNTLDGKDDVTADNWKGTTASPADISAIKSEDVFHYDANPTSLTIHPAVEAFDAVLEYAGASFVRDAVDTRIAEETKNGTFTYHGSATLDKDGKPLPANKLSTKGLIDTQTDVGGWPNYSATAAEIDHNRDSDGDGMPDWFEEKYGLKKTSASDGNSKTLDIKGRYTNVEMYMHYLVKEIVAGGNAAGDFNTL